MPDASKPSTPPKDQKPQLDMRGYIASAAARVKTWAVEHPYSAIGVGLGIGAVAMPGLVAAPLLGGLGFGSGGVAASSIAAGTQAGIGNVAAGSLFATMQSAGAGGAGLVVVNGAVQGAGVIGGVAAAARALSGRAGGRETHKKLKAKL